MSHITKEDIQPIADNHLEMMGVLVPELYRAFFTGPDSFSKAATNLFVIAYLLGRKDEQENPFNEVIKQAIEKLEKK
jgi:hypothetical protein